MEERSQTTALHDINLQQDSKVCFVGRVRQLDSLLILLQLYKIEWYISRTYVNILCCQNKMDLATSKRIWSLILPFNISAGPFY